jgi:predicted ATPase
MLLTLAHIFEMALAPPGSVIIIDEFENSLGVNCMSDLARLISKRADCQMILTSHHPYIINNIPVDAWKLVTRKGGHVRVTSAQDIPEMQSASRLEAFTRLINLPQFEEGIQ